MMDIVERLRLFGSVSMDEEGRLGPFETNPLTAAAADKIERLQAAGDALISAFEEIPQWPEWFYNVYEGWLEARRT